METKHWRLLALPTRLKVVFLFIFLYVIIVGGFLLSSCEGQLTDGGSSSALVVTAPMESNEKETLYLAIQGFVGKSWNGSDLYPDPCGWTPIQGVSCELYDGLWYVTGLNIGPVYENSLRCSRNPTVTSHLFRLHRLTSLSIFNCFPTTRHDRSTTIMDLPWDRLSPSLESLELRSNRGLSGTIPASLGLLMKLQSLILLDNGFAGELPDSLGNLTSMKRLVLSGNNFSGRVPGSLGGLMNLLIVDFSRNSLSGSIPLTFGGLTSLLKLDLSDNKLQGFLPDGIRNMKNLTLMDLSSNNFSGGLNPIQDMGSLRELVLSDNPMLLCSDMTGFNWHNMWNIEVLDLTNTGITGTIPESVAELNKLRHLGLGRNSLSGTPPLKLSAMHRLRSLQLNKNKLSGRLPFPESFYRKMGWRFRAEDNPSLCVGEEIRIRLAIRLCSGKS